MSFLRRTKSTRDARARPVREDDDDDFVALPVSHDIVEDGDVDDADAGSLRQSQVIRRRKSFTSTHNPRQSRLLLGLQETGPYFDAPRSSTFIPTEAERKRRSSMFFLPQTPKAKTRERSSSAAPQPPTSMKLLPAFPFPPRSSSRHAMREDREDDVNAVGLAVDGEESTIGMALGTPSMVQGVQVQEEAQPSTAKLSVFPSVRPSITPPGFVLPAEPIGVQGQGAAKEQAGSGSDKGSDKDVKPQGNGWSFGGMLRRLGTKKSKSREAAAAAVPAQDPRGPKHATLQRRKKPGKGGKEGKEGKATPYLDVDIPSVEMERYSVMFGTLLQPSEKSTIFARRKSRDLSALLNTASTENAPQLPNLKNNMPGADAKPQTPQSQQDRLCPGPLKRSQTMGATVPHTRSPIPTGTPLAPRSPLSQLGDELRRTSFEISRSPSPAQSLSASLQRSLSTSAAERSPRTPSSKADCLSPPPLMHSRTELTDIPSRPSSRVSHVSKVSRISEESSIDTPRGSFDAGDDSWMTRQDDGEPNWEMVTKAEDTTGDDKEDDIAHAAQISIARQISISQRQLLIPVVPRSQRLVSRRTLRSNTHEPLKAKLVEHRVSGGRRKSETAEWTAEGGVVEI